MWNKKIIYKQNLYFTKWVDAKQCTATLIGLGTELGSTVEEATEHITYTSTAPTYEAAVLTIGHAISPLIIIPPRDPSFTVYGTCGSTCTAAVSFQILSNMIHFSALTPILGCPSCSYQYILHTHLVGCLHVVLNVFKYDLKIQVCTMPLQQTRDPHPHTLHHHLHNIPSPK